MTELEQNILFAQQKYYDGEPVLSDEEFDILWDELKSTQPNSELLKKIGSDSSLFPKANHIMVMGSQQKAANEEEFVRWFNKQRETKFIAEFKLDGASLELQYANGKFVKAVTRGDGTTGDDISANVKKMIGIPQTVNQKFTGAIRGEVLMFKSDLKKYFPDMSNPRNGAVGTMKSKDGSGCEHLHVICYDVFGLDTDNEQTKLEWLTLNGFEPVFNHLFTDINNIIDFRNNTAANRNNLEYDIDGVVIKCYSTDQKDLNRDRPEHQIAFKFDQVAVETELLNIEWSKKGKRLTPVAIVSPIELCGTTVQRASIHNMDIFNDFVKKGLKVGSTVTVKKAGEIIPQIVDVKSDLGYPVNIPSTCPTCGSKIEKNGPFLECTNESCGDVQIHRIMKWISTQNIMHLSIATLEKLMSAGLVKNIADLYTLDVFKVNHLDGFGLGFQRVIDEIKRSKTTTLAKFLAGFDMDGIGERVWQAIIDGLDITSFDHLLSIVASNPTKLISVNGIGNERAFKIVEELALHGEELIDLHKILNIESAKKAAPVAGKLSGMSFCFTGALNTMKRAEAETKVTANGGTISSVKKGLTYLVTNDATSGSSKNVKAQSLGIKLIDENQFLAMVN